MWKSCARVWPPLEKMCGVPRRGCRAVSYARAWTTRIRSRRAYLPARRAVSSTSPSCVFRHLSNFTDFDPLSRVPGVGVRYVSSTTDLGRPDLVVLPGSKTTLDDARWLAASGIGACVRALSAPGAPGCSAYAEATSSWETAFRSARQGRRWHRARARARPCKYGVQGGKAPRPVGAAHHGRPRRVLGVERHDGAQVSAIHDGETTRLLRPCGHDWRQTRRRGLRKRVRNLSPRPVRRTGGGARPRALACAYTRPARERRGCCGRGVRGRHHRAREFDRLADGVRGALDMEYVYRIIEEGV